VKTPRTREELEAEIEGGWQPEFVFFYGSHPSPDGRITESCLSQWWEAPFTVDGVKYHTAEHYFMASKAALFGDHDILARILASPHPLQAKTLGRQISGFNEDIWLRHRMGFTVTGNHAKFSQDSALCDYLLSTGDLVLVEASPEDAIWGIARSAQDPASLDPRQWRGLNLLGFALMEVRDILRNEKFREGFPSRDKSGRISLPLASDASFLHEKDLELPELRRADPHAFFP